MHSITIVIVNIEPNPLSLNVFIMIQFLLLILQLNLPILRLHIPPNSLVPRLLVVMVSLLQIGEQVQGKSILFQGRHILSFTEIGLILIN